jgi:nitrogen fixation NifU-like protein
MSDQLDEMYREVIMDHFRSPRGKDPLKTIDVETGGHNPACGDELELQLELDHDRIKDVHVGCKGCAISVASGSMLAEIVKGRPIEEVKRIAELVKRMLKGEDVELPDDLEDIDALKGVRQFPVRIKCALLSWATLMEGIKSYEKGAPSDTASTETEEE